MQKTFLIAAVLAAALTAPATSSAAQTPRLIGAPSVSYQMVERGGERSPSFGAVVKLSRALTRREQGRSRYSLVVAPRLRAGQHLPDEMFGGTSLGRLGKRGRCYGAEPVQFASRPTPKAGARWQLGLVAGGNVLAPVKRVTLRLAPSEPAWENEAMRRLGCAA